MKLSKGKVCLWSIFFWFGHKLITWPALNSENTELHYLLADANHVQSKQGNYEHISKDLASNLTRVWYAEKNLEIRTERRKQTGCKPILYKWSLILQGRGPVGDIISSVSFIIYWEWMNQMCSNSTNSQYWLQAQACLILLFLHCPVDWDKE